MSQSERAIADDIARRIEDLRTMTLPEPTLEDVNHRVLQLGTLFDGHTQLLRYCFQGLNRVETRLDKVEVRLDKVERRLDQTMNMVGDLSNSMNRRFDEVNERLNGIDQRLDGMDKRFDGMDTRFDRIEALLVDLVGRRPQSPSSN